MHTTKASADTIASRPAWAGLDVAKQSFEAAVLTPGPGPIDMREVVVRGFERTRAGATRIGWNGKWKR